MTMTSKLSAAVAAVILSGATFADPFGARPDANHPYAVHDDLRPNPAKVCVNEKGVPSDATVLFDGTAATLAKNWCDRDGKPTKWKVQDGTLVCTPGSGSIRTREDFGDCQLHVEWRAPTPGKGESQGRGNSGVILMGLYEIQVLDTYENRTYADGQAGAVYGQMPPLVNPANPEGVWQSYDIVFHRPVWKDGKQIFGGSFTVFFNGVLTTDNWELEGPTYWRRRTSPKQHAAALPLFLQDHGNPVPYRNIWIRRIKSRYDDPLAGPAKDLKAIAEKRKALAVEAATKGRAATAKKPDELLLAKWEIISYDASDANKQAAKAAADAYVKTFDGISDKDLVAREAEVQAVFNYGSSIGEFGAKSTWVADLPGFPSVQTLVARIARIKKGTELNPTSVLKLDGEILLGKPLPWDQGAPFFNGPTRYGATPDHDFLFTFPVRGSRAELAFSVAKGTLPAGVKLDAKSGVLSGRVTKAGDYRFTVEAKNAEGTALRDFTLVIGKDARAQTPLMGWTSWNSCGSYLTQDFVARNARELVKRGFAARGYAYVNIDSGWQGLREDLKTNALQPNPRLFPNMKGLVDEIHGLGLKAGIYSTPMAIAWGSGISAFGLLPGSTEFPLADDKCSYFGGCGTLSRAKEDAAEWAKLGFDYLKYDWPLCDEKHTVEMRQALDATGRDFQLCITTSGQWELADVYQQNAQLVRSSGDTFDEWPIISACLWQCERWAGRLKRGCWCDVDMLALGPIALGNGRKGPATLPLDPKYKNRLTRDEQIFHFATWAFLPTPLQLSWNLEATDEFTADLVSNEELLALNQDAAGTGIVADRAGEGIWIWKRTLADGTSAWLFANPTKKAQTISWSLGKLMKLRDPIGNRDLGTADGVEVVLPVHGVRMVREVL